MFFALVGHSVKEYIRLRRISLASSDLISSEDNIIDIAVKYGFDSRDSFTRAFKRITGFLPSEYRKQQSKFIYEGVNILDKYYETQDTNLINDYPDIKVLKKLEPMKVAYYRTYSKTPENDAFKVLQAWAERTGLTEDESKYRVFGFDTPDSKYGDEVYGFEVWMTVDNDIVVDDEKVKSKKFEGGLYAVTSTTISDIVKTWDRFREWLKISKYGLGSHQYLEEHLPFNEWNKDKTQGDHKVDLYMPIKEKNDKVKEVVLPTRVAYYRAEDMDSEKSAMRAWDVMLSWAKRNHLDSTAKKHRIFAYNHGFRKPKKYWHEIMITIDDDFDFSDDLVKNKIFIGGNYMTMETNLESLIDTWRELGRWRDITKTKAGRHHWIEEWLIDNWEFPQKGIKAFFPIGE
jgi:DNA gyrase inhibitor GyrI